MEAAPAAALPPPRAAFTANHTPTPMAVTSTTTSTVPAMAAVLKSCVPSVSAAWPRRPTSPALTSGTAGDWEGGAVPVGEVDTDGDWEGDGVDEGVHELEGDWEGDGVDELDGDWEGDGVLVGDGSPPSANGASASSISFGRNATVSESKLSGRPSPHSRLSPQHWTCPFA